MKIALGTDHAGYPLKEKVKAHLIARGYEVADYGCHSEERVDYPLYVKYAAQSVAKGVNDAGVVFGGSGNGEAIAANKVAGIRCALCWNEDTGRLAKQHNNANVIALGGRVMSETDAIAALDAWIGAEFEGDRHVNRLAMLEEELPPPPGFDAL